MSAELAHMNDTLDSWAFHTSVLEASAKHDVELIKNNTDFLTVANDSATFKRNTDLSKKYIQDVQTFRAKKDKVAADLVSMSKSSAFLNRVEKANRVWLLNG